MEEYNLDRDNSNYQSALQAYQNGLYKKQELQNKLDNEADKADDSWRLPVEVASTELVGKPVKDVLKKVAGRYVKKGVNTAEKIITKRGKQLVQKLGDNLKAKLPEGSKLSDVANNTAKTEGEAGQSLRDSFNRLRKLTGNNPISDTPAPDTAPTSTPNPSNLQPDLQPKPSTIPSGDAPKPSGDVDFSNVNQSNFKDANQALKDRFNNLTPEGQSNVSSEFKNTPNLDLSKPPRDMNLEEFKQRGQAMQDAINNQEAKDGAGKPDADFSDADGTLQTPKTISQTGQTISGEADARLADAGADIGAKAGAKLGADVGDIGADVGLESAGATADAVAGSEGGLNVVADLVALGLGIAGLFGASHKDKPKPQQVQYRPINPTIMHGI